MRKPALLFSVLLLAFQASPLSAQAGNAVFEFISTDPNNEGFNDPTPRSEIPTNLLGDNPGATLGEIRLNVLEAAAARWSNSLLSDVPIQVEVDFEDLGGFQGGSISLAGASSATVVQNFTNAPLTNTLYPIALANSLAGRDLSSRPDILVTVNSNDALTNSPTGGFYYGFDSNGPTGTSDFLDIISHELGHGLGFAANVSSTTGLFIGGRPNSFSANIFDTSLDLSWPQMTSAQRITSSRADPNLTWNGPHVTGAIDGVESFVTQGTDASNSNTFAAAQANFGGELPAEGLSGTIALVDDGVGIEQNNGEGSTADLAQDLLNGPEIAGQIALISRGIVNFDFKVRQAEDAGAIAAIVYNNVANATLVSATAGGTVTEPTIPMLFISQESGNTLRDLLSEELPVVLFDNRVTLDTGEKLPIINRLRLFAPATFQAGSSVSHWSTTASPNLLMEPSITRTISPDLDLSILLMKDIGWNTQNITIPHLTYQLWLTETGLDSEPTNTAQTDDFDNDGLTNLEEYYHGTDPRSPNLPQLEFTNSQLRHQRATLANDLILQYQQSEDLTNFTTFSVNESETNLTDQLEQAEVDIDMDEGRRFFRILIETLDAN